MFKTVDRSALMANLIVLHTEKKGCFKQMW